MVAGADGVAVFDALPRRGRVPDAILQAFELLELDGGTCGRCRWASASFAWRAASNLHQPHCDHEAAYAAGALALLEGKGVEAATKLAMAPIKRRVRANHLRLLRG